MTEIEQLERAIQRLANIKNDAQRPPYEKSVLLWGGRVHRWIQETAVTLEKQLHWLDTHIDSPNYEIRFAEWEALLRLYERGCKNLIIAEFVQIESAA